MNEPGTPPADGVPIWEDGVWPGLPRLTDDVIADACVVGLGGSGLAAVHALLDLGIGTVVGIDAGMVAGGAAGRNGGFLLAGSYDFYHDAVARYGRSDALVLYRLTLDTIRRMHEETPAAVRLTGSLRIAASPDEEADCAAQLHAMRADGLPVEPYEGPEGRGLLFPDDGVFDPLRRARERARHALDRGASLHENSPALDIRNGRVATSHGTIRAGVIIAAIDGRLARTFPELAGRVRTARLQMLSTAPTREVALPRPVYWRYGYEYWQQLPDGRVALGGFRDHGGETEWTESTAPSPVVQQLLERHLREVVGVNAPIERRWAASVGYTADGLPVFEEVRPGVLAIGAYSGTGNVLGVLCGEAAACVVTGGTHPLVPLLRPTAAAQRERIE